MSATYMVNLFRAACACGAIVEAGKGKTEPPARRGGQWSVACVACMSPGEQETNRRAAEKRAERKRQHATGTP